MPTKTWILTTAGSWNTAANWSPSGVPTTGDDVIFNGSANGNCTLSTTAGACRSLVMTGYTGTFTFNIGLTVSGSDDGTVNGNTLVLGSGTTYAGISIMSLTSTYGGKITCNGNTLSNGLTINGVGGTFTLTDTLTLASLRTLTLTAGTITGSSASVGLFSVTANTNVKSITLTNLTVSGAGTVFLINTGLTNYTQSITNLNVTGTAAGNKYITMISTPGITNIYFSCTGSGSDSIGFTANSGACVNCYFVGTNSGCQLLTRPIDCTGDLDFGTTSLSWVSPSVSYPCTVGGNLTFSPNMTITTTLNPITLNGTGAQNVIMNGKTFTSQFLVNKASGTATFLDAVSLTAAFTNTAGTSVFNNTLTTTGNITLTAGTLTFNNNNVTSATFVSTNSNVRTINLGDMTWTLTGTGTVWSMGTSTNATLNAGTSRILINNTVNTGTGTSISLGGLTYYTIEFARGATTAFGTFNPGTNCVIRNFIINTTGAASSMTVSQGASVSFNKFVVRGNSGGNVTLIRNTTPSPTFTKIGQGIVPYCQFLSINGISASPANTWYTGVSGSLVNTTGWVLGDAPSSQSLLGAGGVG